VEELRVTQWRNGMEECRDQNRRLRLELDELKMEVRHARRFPSFTSMLSI
jgi:hypothetical protein